MADATREDGPRDDDATLPDFNDELRAIFLPGAPREPARADQAQFLRAAEAFAQQSQANPRAQRQWAEAAPALVRAYFQAIRTTGPQPPAALAAPPPRSGGDGTLPRLGDLSPALQELLALCWPIWDRAGPG